MKHLVTGLLIAAGLVGLAVAPVRAEDALGRDTPRGTMQGYLQATREGDHQRAMEYLNLQRVPRAERATAGPRLARDLRIVLEQTLWIVPETLSDNPATTFSENSALGYMVVTFGFLGAILGALAGVIADIVITRRDR